MKTAAIELRRAVAEDAALLFAWANDPLTRRQSFATEQIAWVSHVDWLTRRLADPATTLLIGDVAGVPVGMVKFDRGPETTISVSVAPDHRGTGIGSRLIAVACVNETGPIVAEIKPENIASQKAFVAAGFVPTGATERALRFVLAATRK